MCDCSDDDDNQRERERHRRRWHCPDCPVPTGPRFVWQEFATGDVHLRMECGGCGKFIRYAPQTAFTLALAGPRPVHCNGGVT